MSGSHEYRLRIDAVSVATMPMARLADYMADLARILGEPECVHFARVEDGSAVLVTAIDEAAIANVEARLKAVREGNGPPDAMKAYAELDARLAKDDAMATLARDGGTDLMRFPGKSRPKPMRYGPFRDYGTLDGIVIRLGGRGDTIPVLLEDAEGALFTCRTTPERSKALALHYRGATVRLHGNGKWVREENGSWSLQEFTIEHFEVLDDSPLMDVVAKLRAIDGSAWSTDEAVGDSLGLRRDEASSH